MQLQVFAEGQDIKFLNDYISFLNLPFDRLVSNNSNGWTTLSLLKPKFEEARNKGFKNAVIFDADGDCENRRAEILAKAVELGIEFDLFLFPNNQSSGCFENLLLSIVQNDKKMLLDCFDAYCSCVIQHNEAFQMPTKSKVFAFLEATQQPFKIEEVNFKNNIFWNFDHDELIPLKEFLQNLLV